MIKNISIALVLILIGVAIGYTQGPERVKTVVEYQTKTVVEERIKVQTVVKELPTGEKITTINYQNDKVTQSDTKGRESRDVVHRSEKYSLSVGTHYVAADSKVLGNLAVGAYLAVDQSYQPDNYGLYLKYSF